MRTILETRKSKEFVVMLRSEGKVFGIMGGAWFLRACSMKLPAGVFKHMLKRVFVLTSIHNSHRVGYSCRCSELLFYDSWCWLKSFWSGFTFDVRDPCGAD